MNGTDTFNPANNSQVTRRGLTEREDTGVLLSLNSNSNGLNGGDVNFPPYAIHNGGFLTQDTIHGLVAKPIVDRFVCIGNSLR